MKKKWMLTISMLLILALFIVGCGSNNQQPVVTDTGTTPAPDEESDLTDIENLDLANGRYRGVFGDSGEQQVGVQFDIEDNVITAFSFRHLFYDGTSFRGLEEGHPLYPVTAQHNQIIEHLVGQPIATIYDLFNPGEFIDDIDTFSGATIRGNKVLSAIKDGLNRGLYVPAGDFSTAIGSYPDGRYRGIFEDQGEQQVSVQFDLKDNVITGMSFRQLSYDGTNFRSLEEGHPLFAITEQHKQIIEHLTDQPLATIFDLYAPGDFIEDIDAFSGATIRGNKVFSAIRDGLNRGLYVPAGDVSRDVGEYEDGRYRGIYGDSGEQQISIQFDLKDNIISNVQFRQLAYDGTNFRSLEEGHPLYAITAQHKQIAEYLEGQPLSAMFDLYAPGDFVEDIDAFSGATIRGNKVFSAMRDALNRGRYQ